MYCGHCYGDVTINNVILSTDLNFKRLCHVNFIYIYCQMVLVLSYFLIHTYIFATRTNIFHTNTDVYAFLTVILLSFLMEQILNM